VNDASDGGLNGRRRVVAHRVSHVFREVRLELLHGRIDTFGALDLIGTRKEVNQKHPGRLSIQRAEGFVELGPEFHARDIRHAHLPAIVAGANNDLSELLRSAELAGRKHGVGELLVGVRRRGANLARRRLMFFADAAMTSLG